MSEYTDYYQNLLILQYKTQPKARGTVGALVSNGPASAYDIGPAKYTVNGSPIIIDNVASNFSTSNFLKVPRPTVAVNPSELDIYVKFKADTIGGHSQCPLGYACPSNNAGVFYNTTGNLYWRIGRIIGTTSDSQILSSVTLAEGDVVTTHCYYKNGKFIFEVSKDNGETWTKDTITRDPSTIGNLGNYFFLGKAPTTSGSYTWVFDGHLYLDETIIKIKDELWFGTLPNPNNLTSLVMNGYDIDTAEGNQLDVLGKYIGLSRNVKEKINSPETVILTDEQYRLLLKLKRVSNISYSSTSQIRRALYEIFPNDIRVFDDRTMRMEYQLSTQFNDLVPVILAEQLLPFPMGLDFDVIVVPDLLQLYGYYGYDGLNDNPNGYSSYTDGFKGKYLKYGDRI